MASDKVTQKFNTGFPRILAGHPYIGGLGTFGTLGDFKFNRVAFF
jgi:hypothetical protein